MQATAIWLSENRFEIKTRNNSFFIGPKPGGPADPFSVDYFTASLAGCVGYYVAKFLSRKGFDPNGLEVSVTGSMVENPHRIGAFDIVVDLPPGLPPELQEVAKRAAESCPIHHTLQHPPRMMFTYNAG
jgi:putative redox protein